MTYIECFSFKRNGSNSQFILSRWCLKREYKEANRISSRVCNSLYRSVGSVFSRTKTYFINWNWPKTQPLKQKHYIWWRHNPTQSTVHVLFTSAITSHTVTLLKHSKNKYRTEECRSQELRVNSERKEWLLPQTNFSEAELNCHVSCYLHAYISYSLYITTQHTAKL
jgi:hypothetical protein